MVSLHLLLVKPFLSPIWIAAPKLFSVAFNIVKKFLDEYTMSKINIYKVGSDKWKEPLFSHVSPDVFPKCFGGNFVDEDGDPECKSKVFTPKTLSDL